MGVVEGDRDHPTADAEKPRRLLDGTEERSLLLRERREEEVPEGHAVQLLALVGRETVREELHERRVPFGEDGERATDVAGRRHVQSDPHLSRGAARVGDRDEPGDVVGVPA